MPETTLQSLTIQERSNQLTDLYQQAMGDLLGNEGIFCAEEIRSRIESFFKKVFDSSNTTSDRARFINVYDLAIVVKNLAFNTRSYVKLRKGEADSLSNIFDIVDKLLDEIVEGTGSYNTCIIISFINQILTCNITSGNTGDWTKKSKDFRDALVFRSYNSLWKIINRFYTEGEDLSKRGLTKIMINTFCERVKSIRDTSSRAKKPAYSESSYHTEREALNKFMSFLSGKQSLVPVYEYRRIGFAIVPVDYPFESGIFCEEVPQCETAKPKKIAKPNG